MRTKNKKITKTIACFALKGGAGKTTFITNFAVYLSQNNYKTVLIDLDPQANVACSFGVKPDIKGLADYLLDNGTIQKICHKINSHLTIICTNNNINSSLNHLKPISLDKISILLTELKNEFDYVLFDCPPAMNWLTNYFLSESNYIFSIYELDFYNFCGLNNLITIIKNLKKCHQLKKVFIVTNKFIKNSSNHKTVYQQYQEYINYLANPLFLFVNFPLSRSIQTANAVLNYSKPLLATKICCRLKDEYFALFEAIKLKI